MISRLNNKLSCLQPRNTFSLIRLKFTKKVSQYWKKTATIEKLLGIQKIGVQWFLHQVYKKYTSWSLLIQFCIKRYQLL